MDTNKFDLMFRCLPDALQFQILCEFVGTHTVRKGKLRRRFDGRIQQTLLNCTPSHHLYLHELPILDERMISLNYIFRPPCCGYTYRILSVILFSSCLTVSRALVENRITGQLSIWYNIRNSWEWSFITDNSATLPPFTKRQYASWESTDKKKGTIWQKVKLYHPERSNAWHCGIAAHKDMRKKMIAHKNI